MFDVALLNQLKEGNREAFNSLFRHYYPRVMAYVTAMVEQEIAEDIVQDVFLYVWENRSKLYVGDGFHSYLFQSAYTRCLDYFKKQQSAEKYHLHVENTYLKEYGDLLREETSAMGELYSKDFYKRLYDLLDQLPAQRREVFILTYIDGLKAKEVSARTHIPQRTVESHIYLTIRYLKERMSKKDFYLLYILLLTEGVVLKNIS